MIATMPLSDDTFATLLLCGGLGKKAESPAPLSRADWNRLVRALIRANWRPGDLLHRGIEAAPEALDLDQATTSRLDALLSQTLLTAAEVDRLAGMGIGILGRGDDAYPSRWKARLREKSPPLLYVAGTATLLERGGIAAVGSRNVDDAGAAFARRVGTAAARAGLPTISGGARGTDREAMFGALEAGGEAIGLMPDGLTRALRAPDVRRWIGEGQLILASPHRPDARFEVWKAMDRNKLIYALADVSIVISSEAGRGGTWAGAKENLDHGWSPLFVRTERDAPDGNRELINLGGRPLDSSELEATADGDFVSRLLHRAMTVPNRRGGQPEQATFLGDGATTGETNDEAVHSQLSALYEERESYELGTDDVLGEEF